MDSDTSIAGYAQKERQPSISEMLRFGNSDLVRPCRNSSAPINLLPSLIKVAVGVFKSEALEYAIYVKFPGRSDRREVVTYDT